MGRLVTLKKKRMVYLLLLTGLGKRFLQADKFSGKRCWHNKVLEHPLSVSQRKFKFKHSLAFNDQLSTVIRIMSLYAVYSDFPI